MAIDTASRRSRRALLGAALGGAAGLAVSRFAAPEVVVAANPPLLLNQDNPATALTTLSGNGINMLKVMTGTQATAIWAVSGSGTAVFAETDGGFGLSAGAASGTAINATSSSGRAFDGSSATSTAVRGVSNATANPALLGQSGGGSTGVQGYSGAFANLPTPTAKTGVHGYAAQDATARGVFGQSTVGEGVRGEATTGAGVWGASDSGDGVTGWSGSGYGVYGRSASTYLAAVAGGSDGGATGVQGYSGSEPGHLGSAPAKTGVYGYADQDAAARGVWGESTVGQGVRGESTTGTGVYATATTGTALQVAGKAKFSRSGRATVAKGRSYVDITVPGGLASNSMVHATLQTYRSGVAIAAVRKNYPTTGKARIYLTKVASTSSSTYVGWFVAEY